MSLVRITERPKLRDPILIEALPGIGLVANIAGLHLIGAFKGKKFCEIHSPSFQAFAMTTETGGIRPPVNELYYARTESSNDLVILYGNTQGLNAPGQYELCERVLDVCEQLGCRFVITIGGMKREVVPSKPRIFCAATDSPTLEEAKGFGAENVRGHIYGAAGLLIGLAGLRGLRGLSILAETVGTYPDATAAKTVLQYLSQYLKVPIDLSRLDLAIEATRKALEGPVVSKGEARTEFPGKI